MESLPWESLPDVNKFKMIYSTNFYYDGVCIFDRKLILYYFFPISLIINLSLYILSK
jgi:hypothetical protein